MDSRVRENDRVNRSTPAHPRLKQMPRMLSHRVNFHCRKTLRHPSQLRHTRGLKRAGFNDIVRDPACIGIDETFQIRCILAGETAREEVRHYFFQKTIYTLAMLHREMSQS